MTKRPDHRHLDHQFARLAAAQEGVASLHQARRLGFSKAAIEHRRTSERWPLALPGVVRLPGAPATPQSEEIAGILLLGDRAVVGHLSAAHALGLDDFGNLAFTRPHFIALRGHHFTDRLTVHSTRRLPSTDIVTVRRNLPPAVRRDPALRRAGLLTTFRATSASRTIIDLAATAEPALTARLIDSAIRQGLTAPTYMVRRLADLRGRGRSGTRLLDELLLDSGGHTWLERRFLRLVRDAGFPRPTPQVIMRRDTKFVARVDFVFGAYPVVVEVSGRLGHTSEPDRRRDARRRNELQALGFRVIEFTTADIVASPGYVTAELTRHIADRRF